MVKFLLNKQGLMGYHNFLQFKANYTREHRELQKETARKRIASQKAVLDNVAIGIKVASTLLIIMAALFGVALYLRE